jgi:methylmalonyl-CoA mutase N-terminal domain/subunit
MSEASDSRSRERWIEEVFTPALPEGAPVEGCTVSGLPVEPLYEAAGSDATLGRPGAWPFTRGPYPTMYRGRPWTMRQYSGFSTVEDTNARFHFLLDRGQKGLSVAFDLPTQMGHDPDADLAQGEVGKVGVSVATLGDFERLFEGIPLDKASVSMTINATAPVLLAFMIAAGRRQGVEPSRLRGTLQNDLLKEYIARGTYRFPPAPSLRLTTDVIAYCNEVLPRFNPISISGYHMREAGCTAVQELAFTLADGLQYVQSAVDRGLDVDIFAARLSFFFNAHNDFFEEIAKFRAARGMWARLMRDRFGATNPDAMRLRFHTQTAGSTLTSQQPDNNVVRVTLQALAAVLGGTQSLHTNSRDEALSLPSEEAALLALRTQQILAEESGVTVTVDPLGGSPFIESLTERLEQAAMTLLEEIDRRGGALAAVEQGFQQMEIHRAAYDHQKAVEDGSRHIVGVNIHTGETSKPPAAPRVDDQLGARRAEEIAAWRAARDSQAWTASLEALESAAAEEGFNLMPLLIDAVEAGATVGEICQCLQRVFGRYEPVSVF